ncbi:MAG: cyclodeaminase/cyclohydrolase family protein, partial [Chthoniobacterales bacterium]
YDLLDEMARNGNPASISDVGVGALATRACIEGAAMNVRINLGSIKDEQFSSALSEKQRQIMTNSEARFESVRQLVEQKLG